MRCFEYYRLGRQAGSAGHHSAPIGTWRPASEDDCTYSNWNQVPGEAIGAAITTVPFNHTSLPHRQKSVAANREADGQDSGQSGWRALIKVNMGPISLTIRTQSESPWLLRGLRSESRMIARTSSHWDVYVSSRSLPVSRPSVTAVSFAFWPTCGQNADIYFGRLPSNAGEAFHQSGHPARSYTHSFGAARTWRLGNPTIGERLVPALSVRGRNAHRFASPPSVPKALCKSPGVQRAPGIQKGRAGETPQLLASVLHEEQTSDDSQDAQ